METYGQATSSCLPCLILTLKSLSGSNECVTTVIHFHSQQIMPALGRDLSPILVRTKDQLARSCEGSNYYGGAKGRRDGERALKTYGLRATCSRLSCVITS